VSAPIPKLDRVSADALRIIYEKGVVRGRELQSTLRISDSETFNTIMSPLLKYGIVKVERNTSDPASTYFSYPPSADGLIRRVLLDSL